MRKLVGMYTRKFIYLTLAPMTWLRPCLTTATSRTGETAASTTTVPLGTEHSTVIGAESDLDFDVTITLA